VTTAKRLFSAAKIACTRGGRVLFQNLSFHLDPGDVVHIAGPNGSGKTSLLRLLAGALPVAAGTVKWNGHDFLEDGKDAHAARIALLPAGEQGLKPQETAGENLAFWASLHTAVPDIDAALSKMDILKLKDTPVRHLSAGQKRRLSLARVFLKPEAKLWLLDEPLNGLDIHSYDLFVAALNAHSKAGGIAALASHYAVEPPKHGTLHRVEVGYGT